MSNLDELQPAYVLNDVQQMTLFYKGLHRLIVETRQPDVTALRVMLLLAVAANPGISQAELRVLFDDGYKAATLSRNIAELSTRTPRRTAGLGWVELRPDEQDLRVKRIFLTRRGRAVTRVLSTYWAKLRDQMVKGNAETARASR